MAERSHLTLESEIPLACCLVLTSVLVVDMWSGPTALRMEMLRGPTLGPQPFILSVLTEESVKGSEDGETAQRFRELFALAEDPGSILSTHVMAHRHL